MASKELQAIVAARERARERGQEAALLTVVRTSGSTYRRPGARMLVVASADGLSSSIGTDFPGSISGGCLEDDAREHALETIRTGRAALVRYDTTAESDLLFGTGAGCRGVVHVLVEPLLNSGPDQDPLACIARAIRSRRVGALASVISVEKSNAASAPALGSFLWVDHPSTASPIVETTILDPALQLAIAADARAAAFRGRAEVRNYRLPDSGSLEVFIDVVRPPRSLLICGAGQDAIPLARLGKELGWRIRVTDGRRAYATRERFPGADELILCPAADVGVRIEVERMEAVVVMTHNYLHDREILRALIPSPAGYIGVLGPRQRTERLLAELASEPTGQHLDLGKFSLRRLHGPAGLDIGAEAPEQIALSIVAEIEAAGAGRDGGMLKRRVSALHRRPGPGEV